MQNANLKNQNDNSKLEISSIKNDTLYKILYTRLSDLMLYLIAGLLIGARLGYVLFYNLNYYVNHPLEVFLPIQALGFKLQVVGYYGMSYHGGLIGTIIAGWIFAKRNRLNFWKLSDFVIPAIPAGFFFGRIGNFLNGELYGRPTNLPWGMYFPGDSSGLLRHPSQLYEAFFEGLFIFLVLWKFRNGIKRNNKDLNVPCIVLYFFIYGLFRFFLEFFREPDPQIGYIAGFFTLGQLLSLLMIAIPIASYFVVRRRKKVYYDMEIA